MKHSRLFLVLLVVLSLLLTSCQNTPDPSKPVPPGGGTASPGGGNEDPPPAPSDKAEQTEPVVPADKFLQKIEPLQLQILLPISWQDRMQMFQNFGEAAIAPPAEDYALQPGQTYINLKYVDEPSEYGHTFEEATQEESLNQLLVVYRDDKIIETAPTTIMGRDALSVTFVEGIEGEVETYRYYLIDAGKGRFFLVEFLIEAQGEGMDGVAAFAEEAEKAVRTLSPYYVDPALITYEDGYEDEDEKHSFTFEYPGDWTLVKMEKTLWQLRPPVGTYDFPFQYSYFMIRYYPAGKLGNTFEESTSEDVLQTLFPDDPLAVKEPAKVGPANAVTAMWERTLPVPDPNGDDYIDQIFDTWATLIDAGDGAFYYCGYHQEKGNDDYEPFVEDVRQIIDSFRMTTP